MTQKISIGKYISQEGGYKSFTLFPFPSSELLYVSPKLYQKHEKAVQLIGELSGVSRRLPDKDFFLMMFVKKDAVYSSQIEGTQATFQDAVAVEVQEEKPDVHPDVDDIIHYIEAINYGAQLAQELPLSLRFIRQIHGVLMKSARSTQHAYPGEFRRSQNWIGGTNLNNATFVPPAIPDMKSALADLEKFIYADNYYPSLLKIALIHAQFETIHPFTDGNGRTGRMLITLLLKNNGLLELPVLYLSNFFKKNKELYYQKLNQYHSENSDLDSWLEFFLDGIIETASSSIETCTQITELRDRDFAKAHQLGAKSAPAAIKTISQLFAQPIINIANITKWTGYSRQGAYNLINKLIELKILELYGKTDYGQKYIYGDYYALFDDEFAEKRRHEGES